ncbi:glycosyltransferase family 31 protein [Xylariaceae sp. AK1471]|nr:glycosyltransferase family 31 protein [Xylariaceae sp. AK1471]
MLDGSRHTSFVSDEPIVIPHYVEEEVHIVDPCASLSGLDDVFVIVRTGFNEVHKKLPSLLNTTFPCFKNYGIWSDMEEEFAGHHIGDALDEIDSGLVSEHADFEYYRRLQEQGRGAFSPEEIASWADAPNSKFGRDTPAWKLDKWKFLPIASKAYRQNPTSKWYMFLECDTYIFWNSLLAWLSHIDSSQPYYLGRQMWIAGDLFAYGGAGILISNPAMKRLVERYTDNLETYNDLTLHQWAGDFILARAMDDAGIQLSEVWPTLEGDMPSTLDLKEKSTKGVHLWCYYATTYHHMNPDDIYSYYDFDQTWSSDHHGLPRNGDIFRHLLFPQMTTHKPEWDNLSSDVQSENATFAECREICENKADCVQFSLATRTCKILSTVKLGRQQDPSSEPTDSGWIMERVEAFAKDMDASCAGQDWVMP